MSPPLVVAFALAATVLWDTEREPLGTARDGTKVFLRDIWPGSAEVNAILDQTTDPETYRRLYADPAKDNVLWNSVTSVADQVYAWPPSTYIAEPPFFMDFSMRPVATSSITAARCLAIFGDSLTTDHISPAGSIKETTPAGKYLLEKGVAKADFQSYGTRRGNHDVMVRGTFANVRIKNLMVPPRPDGSAAEGGLTLFQPSGELTAIYDASMRYLANNTPTIVFGGEEYGTGSSRDWAAKGTRLLGVRAVIARSFERIHRSNLVGMGILPLQFKGGDSVQSLLIRGDEEFDILGADDLRPQQDMILVVRRGDGSRKEVALLSRIDTPIEVDYYLQGGILPYVFRGLINAV
jgi:aconitate hydratase